MRIKKNDFVEVDYTGIVKDGSLVFDTTISDVAKNNNIYKENLKYKPVVLCVGQNQILPAMDKSFEGRSFGDSYRLELPPEDAFGKKDTDFIQFMPTTIFKEHNINPFPGLHVSVDGMVGVVKVVSGNRTLVDFNHPLAGKDIIYEIAIKSIVTDNKEKLKSFLSNIFSSEPEIEIKDGDAVVILEDDIKDDIKIDENKIMEKVREIIPEITTIKFNHKRVD